MTTLTAPVSALPLGEALPVVVAHACAMPTDSKVSYPLATATAIPQATAMLPSMEETAAEGMDAFLETLFDYPEGMLGDHDDLPDLARKGASPLFALVDEEEDDDDDANNYLAALSSSHSSADESDDTFALWDAEDVPAMQESEALIPVISHTTNKRSRSSSASVKTRGIRKDKPGRAKNCEVAPPGKLPRPCTGEPTPPTPMFAARMPCPLAASPLLVPARAPRLTASLPDRPRLLLAACRTIKVRCDREMPCTRCTTLGIECTIPKTVKRGRPSHVELEERRRRAQEEELSRSAVAA